MNPQAHATFHTRLENLSCWISQDQVRQRWLRKLGKSPLMVLTLCSLTHHPAAGVFDSKPDFVASDGCNVPADVARGRCRTERESQLPSWGWRRSTLRKHFWVGGVAFAAFVMDTYYIGKLMPLLVELSSMSRMYLVARPLT